MFTVQDVIDLLALQDPQAELQELRASGVASGLELVGRDSNGRPFRIFSAPRPRGRQQHPDDDFPP